MRRMNKVETEFRTKSEWFGKLREVNNEEITVDAKKVVSENMNAIH